MSRLTNSSIQPWIDFTNREYDISSILTFKFDVQPCQYPGAPNFVQSESCKAVCLNSTSLRAGSINLLNCGLWTELMTLNMTGRPLWQSPLLAVAAKGSVGQVLDDFSAVGLDSGSIALLSAIKDTVSNTLLQWVPETAFSYGTGYQCSYHALFGPVLEGEAITPSAITRCVQTICYTRKLHPEIAGIGVFIAMNMQVWLVIIASLLLIAGHTSRLKGIKRIQSQCDRILTALNEFHQHQCFFFTTLLIAESLALRGKIEQSSSSMASQRPEAIPLLLSACLPIVVTHLLIARYGRLTWYMVAVTLLVFCCSVAVMSAALALGSLSFTKSGNEDQDVPPFLSHLCGSQSDRINLGESSWAFSAVLCTLLIMAYCTVCLLLSTIHHLIGTQRLSKYRKIVPPALLKAKSPVKMAGVLVFCLCFAYQVYIYDKIRKQNLIVNEWTLGQVIAVGIWAPSIVEFLYTEAIGLAKASEIRYPPGWQVVRIFVKSTSNLTNIGMRLRQASDTQQVLHDSDESDHQYNIVETPTQRSGFNT